MAGSLFWLSDEAWSAIEPHLPKNQPGLRRVDDRRVISGIVHMPKGGGRWQDCPRDYGPPRTVYNRWNRWSRPGVWGRNLAAPTEEGWIAETPHIDSSYVKAHRYSGGAKGELGPRPLASRAVAGRRRFTPSSMSSGDRSVSR